MLYLNRDDYVPYAPDTPSQICIPHADNCDNGTDHTARLYIKRCRDGVIKAYCQNCGGRGVYKPNEYIRSIDDLLEPLSVLDLITIPRDAIRDPHLWPVKYKAHLFKYDITYEEIENNNLHYSAGMKRIIIPVYDESLSLVSWQGKTLEKLTKKHPKYFGQSIPGSDTPHYAYRESNAVPVVVLVEDFISAIRVARHLPCIVVHGVHVKDYFISHLIKNHSRVIIFFDDDNKTVRDTTANLKQSLSMVMESVVAIEGHNKDPKEFDRKELREVLHEAYGRVMGSS